MSTQGHENVHLHELLALVREGKMLEAMRAFLKTRITSSWKNRRLGRLAAWKTTSANSSSSIPSRNSGTSRCPIQRLGRTPPLPDHHGLGGNRRQRPPCRAGLRSNLEERQDHSRAALLSRLMEHSREPCGPPSPPPLSSPHFPPSVRVRILCQFCPPTPGSMKKEYHVCIRDRSA